MRDTTSTCGFSKHGAVSRNANINWPARSRDLTPLDVFVAHKT